MMSEKTTLDILKKDIVIPENVQDKADEAFAKIRREAEGRKSAPMEIESGRAVRMKPEGRKAIRLHERRGRRIAAATAAAVIALSTITAGAAYLKWSKGLEKELAVTDEQKEKAEGTGLAGFPNLSVEDQGITITAQQSIIDNYYGYLAFKVEGYQAGKGEKPDFDGLSITVDGKDISYTYGVEAGAVVDEAGSFEYQIQLYADGGKGSMIDKKIEVEFSDLGVIREKAGMAEDVIKGNWAFKWKLTGSDEIYTAKVNEKLGDSGATVTGAEVSPISIKAVYDFPAKMIKEKAYDESAGTEYEAEMLAEPPLLAGVKLKDGTLVMDTQGGVLGYTDGGKKNYEERYGMGRILDVDEVESLLFVKKPLEEERELTEDDLYVVNIR